MASAFLRVISIRENNDYCYTAMLHGHEKAKNNIIKKAPHVETAPLTKKQRDGADKAVSDYLKGLQNG